MGCSSAHTHIEGLKRMRRCQLGELGELGVRRAVGELFGDRNALGKPTRSVSVNLNMAAPIGIARIARQ